MSGNADGPDETAERAATSSGVGRVDRSPTYVSSGLAVLAGVFTAVASTYAPLALASGLAGLLVLWAGLAAGRQTPVTVGGGMLVLGALLAGAAGAPVLATLLATMTALLAFDFATTAIGLGEQLGRAASTAEVELLHAAASTAVGIVVVIAGFTIHEVATGGQPVSALLGLVVVVVILVAALRRSDPTPGRV